MGADALRRWRRRLGVVGLAILALVLLAWRLGILLLERAPFPPGAATVTCIGTLDSSYLAAVDRARRHLRAMLAEREIPGLAVAVAVGDRLVWSEGFGYADREHGVPACPDLQFRLQSVSKPITAAAMARLLERRVLDLDAPIQTYVPDFPRSRGTITARQLASHRSGIRHYRDDLETLNTTSYPTATASLEKFRDDSLLFSPDAAFAYSSYGFVLLGAAMEGATGMDFPTILRKEVFEPLGMARSEAERAAVPGAPRVAFYDNVTPYSPDGRLVPSPRLDFSSKWAGGGILSTPEELARFGTAHIPPFKSGFLRVETLELLFTPRTRPVPIMGYGLGWMAGRDHRLRRVRLHFGAGSGGTSLLAIFPDQRTSIAVLANLGHARFPMARLLGLANPFVADPYGPVAWLVASASLVAAVSLVVAGRRGRRA